MRCPCVMISSLKAMKFMLLTRAHLFRSTYPTSKQRMLGKQSIFFCEGDCHAKLRNLVLHALMPEAIRNIGFDIEAIAIEREHDQANRRERESNYEYLYETVSKSVPLFSS